MKENMAEIYTCCEIPTPFPPIPMIVSNGLEYPLDFLNYEFDNEKDDESEFHFREEVKC